MKAGPWDWLSPFPYAIMGGKMQKRVEGKGGSCDDRKTDDW